MKNALLTVLALASAAPAGATGFYVQGYGGANWDDVINTPVVKETTGAVIGGAVGTSINAVPGLRVEADVSFRTNEVDVGPLVIDHNTTAIMGNLVYDLPLDIRVVPYVLAGVGYAHTEGTLENISLITVESSGVAFQLGGGFNYAVGDGVSVGVGYRYFKAPDIDVFGTNLSSGDNHSFVATVTFDFN